MSIRKPQPQPRPPEAARGLARKVSPYNTGPKKVQKHSPSRQPKSTHTMIEKDYHEHALAAKQPTPDTSAAFPQIGSLPRDRQALMESIFGRLESFDVDVLQLTEEELLLLLERIFQQLGLVDALHINIEALHRFLNVVRASYRRVPFHNFYHAANVAHTMYVFLTACGAINAGKLTPLEQFAALLACIIHDVDHPGLNNDFQVKTGSPLAMLYNDQSVLENHHCATGFRILKQSDVLSCLDPAQYALLRKLIVHTVLATDLAVHKHTLVDLKARNGNQEERMRMTPEERILLMKLLVKCADISNEIRSIPVSLKWGEMVMEEFLKQGDLEKSLGLTPAPFVDREKVGTLAKEQSGFIKFLCMPLYEEAAKLIPGMAVCYNTLQEHLANYAK